ncbi:MAG: hypothetical protein M0Z30_22180 [Actinomycetota bacterium]|nr:hypothetical protein [Actinomycetota bacterium]
MVAAVAALLFLSVIIAIAAGRYRRPQLTYRRRTTSGPSFTSLIAIVGITELLFRLAQMSAIAFIPGAAKLIAGFGVALVVGLVIARDVVRLFLGLVGLALLVLGTGAAAALELAIVVALLAWLLGAVRRLTP